MCLIRVQQFWDGVTFCWHKPKGASSGYIWASLGICGYLPISLGYHRGISWRLLIFVVMPYEGIWEDQAGVNQHRFTKLFSFFPPPQTKESLVPSRRPIKLEQNVEQNYVSIFRSSVRKLRSMARSQGWSLVKRSSAVARAGWVNDKQMNGALERKGPREAPT